MGLSEQQHGIACADDLRALQKPLASRAVLQVLKQHLRIKHFLGNSKNAVRTQIWCAVATYVLIAIVRKELQNEASMHTCLQILSVSVFDKAQLSCAFPGSESTTEAPAWATA